MNRFDGAGDVGRGALEGVRVNVETGHVASVVRECRVV
jgi:hypothetical protein